MECPKCDGEIAINYADSPSTVFGSVRRWSHNRTINDGRKFELPAPPPGSGFTVECPCGGKLEVPSRPDAVSAEREADLRVSLGEPG